MKPTKIAANKAVNIANTNIIKTKRLRVFPASQEMMEEFIALKTVDILKAAYQEMLDGCLAHPDKWEWYAIWMIELLSGEHIGELCFKGLSDSGEAEIGYGIEDSYHGYGYATEAVESVVHWALQQTDVSCVEAETESDNTASIRVLQKCGFVTNGQFGEEGPRFEHH